MNHALRALAVECLAADRPTIVVEVVATRGSVPRDAGTRMLVWADDIGGTIGGGRLEWDAIAKARTALRTSSMPPDEELALGASLGQCCGGAVTLRYVRLDRAVLAAWSDRQAWPVVHVYGAGHVGRAIVRLLETIDVAVSWIDERDDAFPPSPSASNVERVCVDAVEAEVHVAPRDAFHLVVTHQHDLDLRIVESILARGDFAFLGLIGSATKRRRFVHLLARRGVDDAALGRITCPIGIAGITGKEPAHIAIGVIAQLLPMLEAVRDQRSTVGSPSR